MTKATTTYNIKIDRKQKIERLAIEASQKIGRSVKWTELMDILVTEFGKDAQSHLIHKEESVANDEKFKSSQQHRKETS